MLCHLLVDIPTAQRGNCARVVDNSRLSVDKIFLENGSPEICPDVVGIVNRKRVVIPGLEQVIHKLPGVIHY